MAVVTPTATLVAMVMFTTDIEIFAESVDSCSAEIAGVNFLSHHLFWIEFSGKKCLFFFSAHPSALSQL